MNAREIVLASELGLFSPTEIAALSLDDPIGEAARSGLLQRPMLRGFTHEEVIAMAKKMEPMVCRAMAGAIEQLNAERQAKKTEKEDGTT